jgi:Domain of unknown function (DUF4159)
MAQISSVQGKNGTIKIHRLGFFLGAVLVHLIAFLMIATWVIFPALHPPTEDFTKTYLPPPPSVPPPPQETMQVPTTSVAPVPTAITAPTPTPTFNIPPPDIAPSSTQVNVQDKMTEKIVTPSNSISEARLSKIMDTEKNWGRDRDNILESNGDPRNVTAKFPVYVAAYADGDWNCNVHLTADGKIDAGSLPDLIAKMNEWSQGHIKGEVKPTPLDIGGPDLLDKKPPFIFFTGHKNFVLNDQEIQNLRDYLQIGGAIWGDNALAGRGSRFDVAFRREMKRVVPDLDKKFEPMALTHDVFTKSWFTISKVPEGMDYFDEPLEHLDIDGRLAIIYTPNDYSDLLCLHILPGDTQVGPGWPDPATGTTLFTFDLFNLNGDFFHNVTLPSCLAAHQLGVNIIGFLLVRFDKDLLLTP